MSRTVYTEYAPTSRAEPNQFRSGFGRCVLQICRVWLLPALRLLRVHRPRRPLIVASSLRVFASRAPTVSRRAHLKVIAQRLRSSGQSGNSDLLAEPPRWGLGRCAPGLGSVGSSTGAVGCLSFCNHRWHTSSYPPWPRCSKAAFLKYHFNDSESQQYGG